jgi:hypothetical protein
VVHICEPEAGKGLSDDEEKRSEKGLRSFQVGSNESSDYQVGNEMRSLEDLIDCQMGRTKYHISKWAREKRRDCLTVP